MKIRFIKMAIAAIGIVAFAMVLKSCKKVDNNLTNTLPTQNQLLKELKDSLAIHPELANVIIPINEKVPGAFYNSEGQKIYDNKGQLITGNSNGNSIASVYECYPPFMPVTGPSNYSTLVSVTQNYDCSQGYSYTVTWNASSPVNYVSSIFYGSQQYFSQGMVQITNLAGQTLYQNLNSNVSVTKIGDDPADNTHTNGLFQITYTTPFIPFSAFTSSTGANLQFKLLVYTDCTSSNSYWQSNWSVSSLTTGTTSNPCNRIDPTYMNSSQTPPTILGFGQIYSVGGCPAPPNNNFPDRQEIQLAYAGSSTTSLTPIGSSSLNWHDIYFVNTSGPGYNSGNATTQQGTIGCWDGYSIPNWDLYNTTPPSPRTSTANPLHGYYYYRYRDWMASGCRGAWSTPTQAYSF